MDIFRQFAGITALRRSGLVWGKLECVLLVVGLFLLVAGNADAVALDIEGSGDVETDNFVEFINVRR